MPFFTDQLNRQIELKHAPKRIISLVPSQTELLADLGLDEEIVGITKFCVHPDSWFHEKQWVGGTKNIRMSTIKQLQPDLIIANKEENVQEQIEELAAEFPVWVSDINTLEDATKMIKCIGEITGQIAQATAINKSIRKGFAQLSPFKEKLLTAYLIWKDPYMSVGGDTFIHDLLDKAGFQNIFASEKRYPQISLDMLEQAQCKLLLLSTEPYPFKQKHIAQLQKELPNIKIMLVDGEMFSWYGSRLTKAPAYFQQLHNHLKAFV